MSEPEWCELKVRSIWTLLLISSCFVLLLAGHFYFSILIIILTVRVYLEFLWVALPQNRYKRIEPNLYSDATPSKSDEAFQTDSALSSSSPSKCYRFAEIKKSSSNFPSSSTIDTSAGGVKPEFDIPDELQNIMLPLPLHIYLLSTSIIAMGIPWIVPRLDITDSRLYKILSFIMSYYPLLLFSAALLALVMFVLSLKKNRLRRQFLSLTITIATLVYVVPQSLMSISNIYMGMVWFVIPATCVVSNDVAAYTFGKLFGRTSIISVSPKKTVEGFIGGAIVTTLWSIILPTLLLKYKAFTCKVNTISIIPFEWLWTLDCESDPVYKPQIFELPLLLQLFFGEKSFTIHPIAIHSFAIGIFSSFISPFGGFFVSGLKRALKIKDFPGCIPGHGGITDRFDCQIITSSFTFFYIKTMTRMPTPSVESIIRKALLLSDEDRLRLISELHKVSFG